MALRGDPTSTRCRRQMLIASGGNQDVACGLLSRPLTPCAPDKLLQGDTLERLNPPVVLLQRGLHHPVHGDLVHELGFRHAR